MAKTQSSKAIATAGASPASPETSSSRRLPPARNVHFDDSSPVIIPPPPAEPEVESEDEEAPQDTGEYASVLYDFTADGEDEMSVKEGEQLLILERDGDDWWKCQNANGHTGMVPASYLEVLLLLSSHPRFTNYRDQLASEPQSGNAVVSTPTPSINHAKAKEEEAERRRQEQEREQAEQEERAHQEEQERLQKEEEERMRKKREAQEKARAAAAVAEAEREKRKLAAARKAASPPPVS